MKLPKIELSERDKVLLLLLVVLIIAALPYLLFISPLQSKMDALNVELNALRIQKEELETLYANQAEYEKGITEYQQKTEQQLASFPPSNDQEATIIFLKNTETETNMRLSQAGFGEDLLEQITNPSEGAVPIAVANDSSTTDAEAEAVDAKLQNTEVVTTALGVGMTGIATDTSIVYSGKYNDFKSFLNYISEYPERMVIKSITASFLQDSNDVIGNMVLAQYAISGTGNQRIIEEPDLEKGTTNIFKHAAGQGSDGAYVEADAAGMPGMETEEEDTLAQTGNADFFVMLSTPEADVDAVIVGKSNDATETTYLKADENKERNVVVAFSGTEGNYKANYKIGPNSYAASGDGVAFEPDGTIKLQIISSLRTDESDKVAANLDIVNSTDMPVHVTIVQDDPENPRVKITGKTGDVEVE